MLTKRVLGKTGLNVTEFCLGLLPMGKLQANLPEEECVAIIQTAIEHGVNFIDTAESYGTQPFLGKAIQGKRADLVISTKSTAEDYDAMARSVEKSLQELGTDYIDLYFLHSVRAGKEVFIKRAGALDFLLKMREEKVIKAVGIATHHVEVLNLAARRDDLDVAFPIINKIGLGIIGGNSVDMLAAIKKVKDSGKGLLAMKALGGGNLIDDVEGSLQWVRDIQEMDAVAVGVVNEKELLQNLHYFGVTGIAPHLRQAEGKKKRLYVSRFCEGCGNCVKMCANDALTIIDGQAVVDLEKCLLCGYCSPACPKFALRII